LPAKVASRAQGGVTLIELIAFIVIMGISVVALLSMYRAVLPRGATPAQITQATQLAQERMELLLGQRDALGYSTTVLTDPCVGAGAPPICYQFSAAPVTGSFSYSVIVTGINPPVPWSGFSVNNYRLLGVRVLGPDGNQLAGLSAVIGNY
jgi:Tfp pilus assembly protein PilE